MYYNAHIGHGHNPGRSYSKVKEISHRKKEDKKSGGRRRSLDRISDIEKLPKHIGDLIYSIPHKYKDMSTQEKAFWGFITFALLTGSLYLASDYLSKSRIDRNDPEIKNVNLPKEIPPGRRLSMNFTAIDMDAKGRVLPENIAHASVRVTGGGYDVNKTAKRLEGDLFSAEFGNLTKTEGPRTADIIVRDHAGNTAKAERSFEVRDRPPTICNFDVSPAQIEVEGEGDFTVALEGKDDVGVAAAQAQVHFPNGTARDVAMGFNGTHHVAKIPGDQKGVYDFSAALEDTKGQSASVGPISRGVSKSFLDKYVEDVADRGIKERTAVEYFARYRGIVERLYDENFEGLVRILEAGDNNSTSNFDKNPSSIITNLVYGDSRIPMDKRDEVLVQFADLLNDLGVTGFKHMNTYQSAGNYTHALQRYARHLDSEISQFLGMSEMHPIKIQPLVLRGVDGQEFRFEDNVPRTMWMICELAKQRPEIINRPEMFEGIYTQFVPSVGWSLFDNGNGPMRYESITYSADNPKMWNSIILPFFDYMADPHLGKSDRTFVYPIFNNTAAEQYISDKTDRTVAGWLLCELPGRTVDKRAAEPGIVVAGYPGTELFVEQLPEEYERIKQAMIDYPTSTPDGSAGDQNNPRWWWWQWLNDQKNDDLVYTVEQFRNIDGILSENSNKWNLIKFIYSYERYRVADYLGEPPMYRFGLPLGFKSFGVPSSETSYEPRKAGAGSSEWAVSIPDSAINALRYKMPNDRVVIGHGNMLSLYSAIDGAEEDGIEETFQVFRNKWPIYNWLKD
jgi:hypothetical protein